MIVNIKFRKTKFGSQSKLKSVINRKTNHVFVPADKRNNHYKLNKGQEQVHTEGIKTNMKQRYNSGDYTIGQKYCIKLELCGKINVTVKREASTTLKRHKPNFSSKTTCRLINLYKPQLRRISIQ